LKSFFGAVDLVITKKSDLGQIRWKQNMTEQVLTNDDIAAMKMRCEKATLGPWKSYVEGREQMSGSNFIMTGGEDIYLTGATVADQDFIAHAREDIPKLVVEIERLRRLLPDHEHFIPKEQEMRASKLEVEAAARVLHDAGSHYGWWPRHLTYEGMDPIGRSEFGGIVERILMAAAAARAQGSGNTK